MFKSNEEMIAEIMPDDNTILILRKDLQTHNGIIAKGKRVILRQGGTLCDNYKVIMSGDYSYIYLSDMIKEKGECLLSTDVTKYPQRIHQFVKEHFMIDFDRTKEYKSYLERRHINVGLILFLLLWLVGLITISIFGWIDKEWCDSGIFNLPDGNIMTGILNNIFFGVLWCILGIMGTTSLAISNMHSITRKNEEVIKKLLQ